MPLRFGDVPPDHPMFHGGVLFVFRSDLPEEPEDESEHDDEGED